MDILIKGLTFGLILSLAMGPVFVTLVQTSIEKGFVSGVFMAIGISMVDLTYVILSYIGISKFANNEAFKFYVGLIGGAILIIFGIVSFLKKKVSSSKINTNGNKNNIFRSMVKGMVVNGVNPFVLLFWLGAMSLATIEYGYSAFEVRTFFLIVLLTVFISDILKSYMADKLSNLFKPHVMKMMNSVVGLLLVGFGVRLLYQTLA